MLTITKTPGSLANILAAEQYRKTGFSEYNVLDGTNQQFHAKYKEISSHFSIDKEQISFNRLLSIFALNI